MLLLVTAGRRGVLVSVNLAVFHQINAKLGGTIIKPENV